MFTNLEPVTFDLEAVGCFVDFPSLALRGDLMSPIRTCWIVSAVRHRYPMMLLGSGFLTSRDHGFLDVHRDLSTGSI